MMTPTASSQIIEQLINLLQGFIWQLNGFQEAWNMQLVEHY